MSATTSVTRQSLACDDARAHMRTDKTFACPIRIARCICSVLTPAGRIHSSALRLGRRAGQLQGLSAGIKRKDRTT